jgi:hypothetical protein
MKISKILNLSVLIILFTLLSSNIYSQGNTLPVNKPTPTTPIESTKYGALAIDRTNGFFYGLAADCSTLPEAEKKAIEECNKKGGKCTVVLSYSGTGCAAYRYSAGNKIGLAFGWGLSKTKEEADAIAKKEHLIRSYGMAAPNVVYNCNSAVSGALKTIYNASDEISTLPGEEEDY